MPGIRRTLLLIAAVALFALAAAYWGKGFVFLTHRADAPDLRRRWICEQYFLNGQNPYDVWAYVMARDAGREAPRTTRKASPDPAIGDPQQDTGIDPPWAFVSGLPFLTAGWPAVRITFAAWQLAALLVVAGVAWRIGRELATLERIVLVAGFAAMGSIASTLGLGQYGILVIAFLALSLALAEKGRDYAAGLFLGLALIKPTLSGPFVFCFLMQRRWRVLAIAAAYVAAASGIAWAVTKTNPIEMLRQMSQSGAHIVQSVPGLIRVITSLGVPQDRAVPVTALLALAAGLPVVWYARRADLLIQFAIAAVVARIWTYHWPYDDVVLVFLLLALARESISPGRNSGRVLLTCAFVLAGAALWAPSRLLTTNTALLIQHLCFGFGVLALMLGQRAGIQTRSG